MTVINILIAVFAGIACGIFCRLFLLYYFDRLEQFKESYAETTANRFADLFMFVDMRKLLAGYGALLIVLPLLTWIAADSFLPAAAVLVLLIFAPHFILKTLWQRRIKKIERQLPDALLMMSGAMKSGASLSLAMDNVARDGEPPLSQEFRLYIRQRKLGVKVDAAIDNMEQRINLEDFSMMLAAVRISREVGGNLAETLESLAETLRQKLIMEGKIASLTAQGRMQGIVMSLLPLLLMGVLMKLEPKAMGMMFNTKLGLVVLGLIIAMQILGYLSIRKITNIDV
jgi:tight adherence protein B